MPRAATDVDLSPYIDAPYIEIGKLAQVYGRKHGHVVCDDLLGDTRHVSVVLNFDNPHQIEGILASYGYRAYRDRELTYWCGSSDPFAGSAVYLVTSNWIHGGRAYGPVVDIVTPTGTQRAYLSNVASHNDLTVTFENCAYQLRRPNGRVVRVLSDQRCLASLNVEESLPAQKPVQEGDQKPVEREAPRASPRQLAADLHASAVNYGPDLTPSSSSPATAARAIAAAVNAGEIAPDWRAPGMTR